MRFRTARENRGKAASGNRQGGGRLCANLTKDRGVGHGAGDMACRAEAVGGTGKPDHGEGGGMGPGASPNGLPSGYGVASGIRDSGFGTRLLSGFLEGSQRQASPARAHVRAGAFRVQAMLGRRRGCCRLQFRRPVHLAEIPIKRAKWQMPGLSRKFDEEAVGESTCGSPPKRLKGRRHRLWLLERQALMVQEHLDRPGNLSRVAVVDRAKHPRGFGHGQY